MNRLTKYDYIIKYRLYKINIMRLINEMLYISDKYNQYAVIKDSKRIIIILTYSLSYMMMFIIRFYIKYRNSK